MFRPESEWTEVENVETLCGKSIYGVKFISGFNVPTQHLTQRGLPFWVDNDDKTYELIIPEDIVENVL